MTTHVEVLYVSSAAAPAEFDRIENRLLPETQSVTYGMPHAAFKFHNLIQQGLLADSRVRLHSIVGRPVSSRFHERGWWKTAHESIGPRHTVVHPGFPNLPVAKQLVLTLRIGLAALKWRVRTRQAAQRVVIVDGAYVTGLPAVFAALRGAAVSRVGIFGDIYSYMTDIGDASDRQVGATMRMLRLVHAANVAQIDAFVILTEAMAEALNLGEARPHIVMEGIVDATLEASPGEPVTRSTTPMVLYAGALRREYGVADLVEGMRAWDHPGATLVVYGAGDYADELMAEATRDPRIDFRGTAPLEEVLRAEREAWLLVNPRPADREFTRYSFPSKNMEYLASGTATLTTRLPGMPPEYYEHVLTIEGGGVTAVTEALRGAVEQGLEELDERGRRGREFVLKHKNNRVQAGRILALVGVQPEGENVVDGRS